MIFKYNKKKDNNPHMQEIGITLNWFQIKMNIKKG